MTALLNRAAGAAALRAELRARLRIPAMAAPMYRVSGPDLVVEACRAGVIGAFPSTNAPSPEILEQWLQQIVDASQESGAPFALNLVVHGSNKRLEPDLALAVRYHVPIVITSVGAPDSVAGRIHGYGGTIFADVASVRHARKAVAAGADGLVLLTAGAGGQTGWLNPFAFITETRSFFDGPIAVAGCISHGRDLRALEILGADLGYMGTAFLASTESIADQGHKDAAVLSTADDIILTDKVTGIPGSFLRAGLDVAGLSEQIRDASAPKLDFDSWSNVWSAGQGVGHVHDVQDAAVIVERLAREYSVDCSVPTRIVAATIGELHADGL